MARIGFLFLIAFCVYFACDRQVFALPKEVILEDIVKNKGKDTLRLDTTQIIREYLDSVNIIHRRLQLPMDNAKL